MKELLTLLNTIHQLSPGLRHYLVKKVQHRVLAKKELLLQAGQISRHVYFIRKGLLRTYYMEGEQEVCSKFMKEGDITHGQTIHVRSREDIGTTVGFTLERR